MENDKGQKVRVCQKMFLTTISLSTDKTIGTVLSKSGGSRTNNLSDNRGKAESAHKKTSETSDSVNHHIIGYNQVSVTIDEVTRPTGCIFLQSKMYMQCSRTTVADIKMLRFLRYIELSKEIYGLSKEIPVISVNFISCQEIHK